jgi:hypothetical protein
MNQIKDIVEKAKQIVSVCQEEKNIYKNKLYKQVREKYHVRIEDGEECYILIPKKEIYPNEDPDGYPFDIMEFLDGQPKNKNLWKIPAIVGGLQDEMVKRIKMRCNLKELDIDECCASFIVDDYLTFEGSLWAEDYNNLTVKTTRPVLRKR